MFFNKGNIDNESLYKVLNLDKNATENDIKKSYRKLSKIHHPDKGGNEEKFQEITKSYEILSDQEKKEKYDKGGIDMVENNFGGNPMAGMNGIFNQFFNKQSTAQKKGKPLIYPMNITLEEIYNGVTKKIKINRKCIDKSSVIKCKYCDGRGSVSNVIRMGPMVQQIQQPCNNCNQRGKIYNVIAKSEIVNINIPKGAPNNHKIILYEKGDEILDGITSDIHIILNEQKHKRFIRKGYNLFINETITITEALTKFNLNLTHLDNRTIIISNDSVIKPTVFDPINDNNMLWNTFNKSFCTLEPCIKAEINDLNSIKKLIEIGQLKNHNITGFCIQNKETLFYNNSETELKTNKVKDSKCKFYVKTLKSNNDNYTMTCIEDEGLPIYSNPILKGDLFINFKIIFPDKLFNLDNLIKLGFPKPIKNNISKNNNTLEKYTLINKNPFTSYINNQIDSDSDDESDEEIRSSNVQQCSQQ
tara:strand:- start:776 stop:2197 length:1422 start_codon:yes stop_codon:yes gene_type:complete